MCGWGWGPVPSQVMHLPQDGSGKDSRDLLGALALSVGHTFCVPGVALLLCRAGSGSVGLCTSLSPGSKSL